MAEDDSTIYGLPKGTIEWTSDFTAERDTNNKWTGGESFTCNLADVTLLIPAKGSPCQHPGFTFLQCNTVKVANIEGNLALVSIGYSGYLNEDDGDGDEEGEGNISYTYELGITTSEEPLESHYRYKDVPLDEKNIIANVKSGTYVLKTLSTPYEFIEKSSVEGNKKYVIESDLGKELVDFISAGLTDYLVAGQIWRATFTSDKLPEAAILNAVGKITSAINAPTLSEGRNWLFLGCNVTNTDGLFTITYEWRLSGLGGWVEEIYTLNPPTP